MHPNSFITLIVYNPHNFKEGEEMKSIARSEEKVW